MKKTQRKKLVLDAITLRTLATQTLSHAHGALQDSGTCRICTVTLTCKMSLCISCYDSDCCLEVP